MRLSVRDTASAVASISRRLFTSPVYSSQVSSMMSQMLVFASLICPAVPMVLAVLRRTAARPSRVCLVPSSSVAPVDFMRASVSLMRPCVSRMVLMALVLRLLTVFSVSCKTGS